MPVFLCVITERDVKISKSNLIVAAALAATILISSVLIALPIRLAQADDGNLYVGSGTNEVKRYSGSTGAFIDNFVAEGSGGLKEIGGMTFAVRSSSPSQESSLTINSVDLSGNSVNGLWTVIQSANNGTILKTGFTPLTFTGNTGTVYKVSVANYDGKIFSRWGDGSRSSTRTIMLTSDITLTATYDTGDTLRGFTFLTYTGTKEQPDLTVSAVANAGSQDLQMWAIIDPMSTDASTGMTTYKVYVHNYRGIVFDHWDDESKNPIRVITIGENKAITAFYNVS